MSDTVLRCHYDALQSKLDELQRPWTMVAWRFRTTVGDIDRGMWRLTDVPPWMWAAWRDRAALVPNADLSGRTRSA